MGDTNATTTTTPTVGEERVPVDQLAQFEADKSVLFFGVVPLIVIAVLALAATALYFYRRSKNWNELGEAMRLDGGDTKVGADAKFDTAELAEMEPTRPSQRVSQLKD